MRRSPAYSYSPAPPCWDGKFINGSDTMIGTDCRFRTYWSSSVFRPQTNWRSLELLLNAPISFVVFLFSIVVFLTVFDQDARKKEAAGEASEGR